MQVSGRLLKMLVFGPGRLLKPRPADLHSRLMKELHLTHLSD